MTGATIICPNCKAEFPLTESLAVPMLIEELESRLQQNLRLLPRQAVE